MHDATFVWHLFYNNSFLTNMENLPEEIILEIFSFLPLSFVFKMVPLVSKQFRRLAYDRNLIKFATDMIQEVDLDIKQDSFCPEAFWKLLNVINLAPPYCVKSLTLRNGKGTWEILQLLQESVKRYE